MRPAHGDSLDALRAHDGAIAGAANLSPVVIDEGETHQVLTRGAYRADANVLIPQALADGALRGQCPFPQQVRGIEELDPVIIDEDSHPLRGLALEHEAVPAGPLHHLGEETARQRIPDHARERRLGCHTVFGADRHGRPGECAARKAQCILGPQWIATGRCVVVDQPSRQADATQVLFQELGIDLLHPGFLRGHVDVQDLARIRVHGVSLPLLRTSGPDAGHPQRPRPGR